MYSMKEVCEIVGISYETLKFYCKEGLVPNVKRNKNNYRVFDDRNIEWLKGLQCLRKCGMSIKDMKQYMQLCTEGKKSIPNRKGMLNKTKTDLLKRIEELEDCIDFIDNKQQYFDDVLEGKTEYRSSIVDLEI